MRFSSLGSGSRGNATLVEWQDTCVMVDCGFSVRETVRRLAVLGRTPEDINAIVVTHEHSDHWKGVLPFAKKFGTRVFLTAGCLKSQEVDERSCSLERIDSHNPFQIGDLCLTPVPVPHDAREPVQFIFEGGHLRFGVLTDLGSLTPYVEQKYADCDGLLVEANHDLEMLANGSYPAFLKERVGGQWGHLNNQQTASLLSNIDLMRIQRLVIGHISDKNNSLELVKRAVAPLLHDQGNLHYATQNQGFNWLELT